MANERAARRRRSPRPCRGRRRPEDQASSIGLGRRVVEERRASATSSASGRSSRGSDRRRDRRRRIGIEDRDGRDLLPGLGKLPGHLERDEPAERPAAEVIGPVRLRRADRLDVARGHLFERRRAAPIVLEPGGLEAEERAGRRPTAGQLAGSSRRCRPPGGRRRTEAASRRAGSARAATTRRRPRHSIGAARRAPRSSPRGRATRAAARRPNSASTRASRRIASSEWPPRSKKSSAHADRPDRRGPPPRARRASPRARRAGRRPRDSRARPIRTRQARAIDLARRASAAARRGGRTPTGPCASAAARARTARRARGVERRRVVRRRRRPRAAAVVAPATTRPRGRPAVPQQGRLDLAGLDPEAADLDLVVEPAEEFERAVGPPAGAVARPDTAAHPGVAERVGDEPLGRQRRAGRGSRGRRPRRRCRARPARRSARAGA